MKARESVVVCGQKTDDDQ